MKPHTPLLTPLKKGLALLLLASPLLGQAPRKYDPASLQAVQTQIAGINAKLDTALVAFRAVSANTQRINAISLKLTALTVQVAGLDVAQNSDRLTRVEDKIKSDDTERERRHTEAKAFYVSMAEWLKWICGGIGALVLVGLEAFLRRNRRDSQVDGAISSVKADTLKIEKQTNGQLTRLQAENDRLRAAASPIKL
jgi:hypothetical protein